MCCLNLSLRGEIFERMVCESSSRARKVLTVLPMHKREKYAHTTHTHHTT